MINKIIKKYQKDGFISLCRSALRYLYRRSFRRILSPNGPYVEVRGVKIGAEEYRSRRLDKFMPFIDPEDLGPSQDHKKENSELIECYVEKGDNVIVVGGGDGINSVVATHQVGEKGSVIIYEGAEKQIEILNKTLSLNSVEGQTQVEHAIVGKKANLKSSAGKAEKVYPSDLPSCDVLEMDCEGAEIGIIEGISSLPGRIIVETHPRKDAPTEIVKDKLEEKGYEIIESKPDRISGDVLVAKKR